MKIVDTPEAVRAGNTSLTGLVPTMGFLHEGHLSLVKAARESCDRIVMSLFVNPLQFDNPGDLERYPRDFERDATLAEEAGVDVLFAPSPEVMYPVEPLTKVVATEVTEQLEGEHRPGHFEGVATVVAKLFASLQPSRAYFGRKDHQQLVLVRRMALDLSFPVEVEGCPIVREPDGLALSSRNIFLRERDRALTISRGLQAAGSAVEEGVREASRLTTLVEEHLDLDAVDYVALAGQDRARTIDRLDRPAFLAVAGHLGDVRLIDNLPIDLVGEMFVPDYGTRLASPSTLARP